MHQGRRSKQLTIYILIYKLNLANNGCKSIAILLFYTIKQLAKFRGLMKNSKTSAIAILTAITSTVSKPDAIRIKIS